MKAKLVDSIRPGDWIYEVKLDGYRALALRSGSETKLLSRNQKDLGKKFPEIVDAIGALDLQDAIVKFTEWTRDDRLRQPVFLGIREDKSASEVIRERAS
jgi:ATP-dependent DNA ligase